MGNYTHKDTIDFYIRTIGRTLKYTTDEQLSNQGLTSQQGRLLGIINLNISTGEHISRKLLQEKTGLSGPSITSLLDGLENKGYIVRGSSNQDCRALDIIITKKGKDLICDVQKVFKESEATLLKGMTDDEVETFRDFLNRAYANIK